MHDVAMPHHVLNHTVVVTHLVNQVFPSVTKGLPLVSFTSPCVCVWRRRENKLWKSDWERLQNEEGEREMSSTWEAILIRHYIDQFYFSFTNFTNMLDKSSGHQTTFLELMTSEQEFLLFTVKVHNRNRLHFGLVHWPASIWFCFVFSSARHDKVK